VTFTLTGSNGDADLYGKFGEVPTTNNAEAKSETATSNETITIQTNGRVGKYYIFVKAFTAYTGLTVKGTHNGGTTEPPPPTGIELGNGIPKTGLSGATGSKTRFTFTVPAGATKVTFITSGGSGDSDLYIRLGSQADTGTGQWNYRSIGSTNSENITLTSGTLAGTWHVTLYGYKAYSGLTITATHSSTTAPNSQTWTNLSASAGSGMSVRQFVVRAGATNLKFQISGGTGDADLYVRYGSAPTTSSYTCRPYLNGNSELCTIANPTAGTWYIGLYPYTSYSGVTLTASHQ
jgi:serine protease